VTAMKPGAKWTLGVLAAAMLAAAFTVSTYRTIRAPVDAFERSALNRLQATGLIADIERTSLFFGDEPVLVAFGQTRDGRRTVAWATPTVTHAVYADEGVGEDDVRRAVADRVPGARVIRVLPGIYQGEYVWEVYYRAERDGRERSFYDYYRFEDGRWLETIRLLD